MPRVCTIDFRDISSAPVPTADRKSATVHPPKVRRPQRPSSVLHQSLKALAALDQRFALRTEGRGSAAYFGFAALGRESSTTQLPFGSALKVLMGKTLN